MNLFFCLLKALLCCEFETRESSAVGRFRCSKKKQSLAHWDLEQKQRLTLAALSSCCCYETSEDQLEAHSGERGTIFTFYWVWGGGERELQRILCEDTPTEKL